MEDNGSQVVQFSHFSVKEFLMSIRLATSTRDIAQYHVLLKPAHTILARACLRFLLHLDDNNDDEASKGLSLAKYAAQHWVAHAQFEGVASDVKDGMEKLFDPDKPHFAAWVRIHNIDPPLYWGSTSPSKSPNPLYYSSLCGLHDLVEHLVGKHPKHLNAIGGRYQSPLLAALRGKHIQVAKLLLKHGGDVDVRGMRNQTPLHNVTLWSHHTAVEAVQFLLEHGANVNARQGDFCTPLHLAADIGALEVAQILIEKNADIDPRNNKGQTPLHLVTKREISLRENNRRKLVQSLLEQGADVNARDMSHETPLHFASCCGRVEIARVLLDSGANVNMKNHRGLTSLHLVLERARNCDSQNDFDLALLLLKHGADVDARYKDNTTPLHFAFNHGRIGFVRLLLGHGANANAENDRGRKPLHLVSEGDYNSQDAPAHALLLLERGADVDTQDKACATPLHFASFHGKLEMARVLLDHGANANAQNDRGQTPLHLLVLNHGSQDRPALAQLLLTRGADVNVRDKDHKTPLIFAAFYEEPEIIRVLLDNGAGPNEKDDRGQTPLHIVCGHDSEYFPAFALLLLLEHGAGVNAQDRYNVTPLHVASFNARPDLVYLLLEHGANANAENNRGRTPLHVVVLNMNRWDDPQVGPALVRLLLRRGANANAQTTDHVTPLHIASYHGIFEIIETLIDHGANADATNDRGQTPLHLVSQGEYQVEEQGVVIARLLLKRGAGVDTQDKDQANALHMALSLERFGIAQVLLEHSTGANAENIE